MNRIRKSTVFVLAFVMVLSMTLTAFAAPYDFAHKTDDTKVYTFLDVASTSTVLLDIVSSQSSYLVEGNDGEMYELNEVLSLTDTGKTFSEAVAELDSYEVPDDNTNLAAAVEAAEELIEEDYTVETWTDLEAALALPEETQEEKNIKAEMIFSAINNLIKKVQFLGTFDELYYEEKSLEYNNDGIIVEYFGIEELGMTGLYNIYVDKVKLSEKIDDFNNENLKIKLDGKYLRDSISNEYLTYFSNGTEEFYYLAGVQQHYNSWTEISPNKLGVTANSQTHELEVYFIIE